MSYRDRRRADRYKHQTHWQPDPEPEPEPKQPDQDKKSTSEDSNANEQPARTNPERKYVHKRTSSNLHAPTYWPWQEVTAHMMRTSLKEEKEQKEADKKT
ncbi:hypothetical protein ABW21_db0203805 [Orbilia brochopaga]|nr:hypothetical protein ABW21_db0203805 [Drechslerella brochopaga]